MHEENPGGLPPSPLPRSVAKAPNYRSPDRVELRYDGLLALDPALSDAGLISQLAIRDALMAGSRRRGSRMHRRILQGTVWAVMILTSAIIGSQFYMEQYRVHATDVVQRSPGLLRASAATAMPGELEIPNFEHLRVNEDQRVLSWDETVRQPQSKTLDEMTGGVADAARRGSDTGTISPIVSTPTAELQAELPSLLTSQQAPAKRPREAVRSSAGNRPQECSDAVLALQLCRSER